MTCKKCRKTIDENSKTCEFCGEKVDAEDIPCQPQDFDTQNQQYSPMVNDKKSIGFNFLGFFIPLVGIIMYFVDREKYPKRSKSLVHCSIAGTATYVVIALISISLVFVGFSQLFEKIDLTVSKYDGVSIEQTTEAIETSEKSSKKTTTTEKQTVVEATTKKGTSDFVPKEIGKNWSEMAIEVNGQKISLPCTYKEFAEKTGFKLSEKDAKRELAGIDDTKEIVSSNGVMFDIFLQNMVDVPKNYEDCFVNGIYLESHDNVENIVISPKIHLNQNLSEALKLLGSPYETFTSPDISFCTYTYTFGECPTARMLEIVSYDGVKIAAITLKYI